MVSGMGREHLAPQEMLCLLEGENDLDALIDGLTHLLGCSACWKQFRRLHPEKSRSLLLQTFGREDPLPSVSPQRLRETLRDVLQDVRESHGRLEELLALPASRRPLLVRNSRRFQTVGLASHLLEEARITWTQDVWAALEWVELALLVLRHLSRIQNDPGQLNDLMARAFVYRGNCHRIAAQLSIADRDFSRARIYLEQGNQHPLSRAFVDEYEASLRRAQCRFSEGAELERRAREAYREVGDLRGEARLLILEAMNLRSAGNHTSACHKLRHVLASFQPEELGRRLLLYAKHNLATYLTELGRIDEARELLPELHRLYEAFKEPYLVVRLCWLEAKMLARLGEIDAAVEHYLEVRDHFVEQRIGYEVALVSLDLAALYLDNARTAEAKELAAELVPLFDAHETHRESSAALSLFCRAVEQERATAALAKDVAGFLKRAQSRPDVCYEPPIDIR